MPLSAETIPAILAIDTAAAACSVALGADGVVHSRTEPAARQHAAALLPMVDAILIEANRNLQSLDAIAVNCGPGSFTGLRIGVSVAQGLAAGAGLPAIPVSSLQALALVAKSKYPDHQGPVVTAIDARMDEIYVACWDVTHALPEMIAEQQVCAPGQAALAASATWEDVLLVGSGAAMVIDALPGVRPAQVDTAMVHSAADVLAVAQCGIGQIEWCDAAALEPVYLRDKVTG